MAYGATPLEWRLGAEMGAMMPCAARLLEEPYISFFHSAIHVLRKTFNPSDVHVAGMRQWKRFMERRQPGRRRQRQLGVGQYLAAFFIARILLHSQPTVELPRAGSTVWLHSCLAGDHLQFIAW